MQVFGKDSILHLGHVETADSRDAWANAADPEARRRRAAARVAGCACLHGLAANRLLVSTSVNPRQRPPSRCFCACAALWSTVMGKEQQGDLNHDTALADRLRCRFLWKANFFPLCQQEAPAAGEGAFRDTAVADHDDIRGVRMGAGERSYLVRDRRIDVLRNVHGGVQARRYLAACTSEPRDGATLWERPSRGT